MLHKRYLLSILEVRIWDRGVRVRVRVKGNVKVKVKVKVRVMGSVSVRGGGTRAPPLSYTPLGTQMQCRVR